MHRKICLAAIVKDEGQFIDEWLVYHRLLGVDHFFLYDDDPAFPLAAQVHKHRDYVTVVPWCGRNAQLLGRNRQTKAYMHAATNLSRDYEWIAFIDVDEFIVLRSADNLREYLSLFPNVGMISLNWHVFGHNGFYHDPPGLITQCLVRRKLLPSQNVKSITRVSLIEDIDTAHFCRISKGYRIVDGNGKSFSNSYYPGKTECAHINHYQCRSFENWMSRAKRGEVSVDNEEQVDEQNLWRFSKQGLLEKFVTTVALDKNEFVDEFMLTFSGRIREGLLKLK